LEENAILASAFHGAVIVYGVVDIVDVVYVMPADVEEPQAAIFFFHPDKSFLGSVVQQRILPAS
jgi:hypothetical protein